MQSSNKKLNKQMERIWNSYRQKLSYFIQIRFNTQHDTEDLIQEIMFKIYNNLEKQNHHYNISTWIYSIARNHCIDYLRKKSKLRTAQLRAEIMDNMNTPENKSIEKETNQYISKTLKQCSPTTQEIAFLRFYENLSYKKIAQITGKSIQSVKNRLFLAKKKLKKALKDYV